MQIDIRDVCTHEEYEAVQYIQHDAWGRSESIVVPSGVMITAQKNGGLVLGAFVEPTDAQHPTALIGFVFGFVGLTATGALKHCSHMTGVLPRYWNSNVAFRLKIAQRGRVLAQGIGLITWTFDPLESRNAYLNVSKLGALSNTYLPNVYGVINDSLNAGLPTDRLQVDWYVASRRVVDCIGRAEGQRQSSTKPTLADMRACGVPVIVGPRADQPHSEFGCHALLGVCGTEGGIEARHMLVEVPGDFQAVKGDSMELAHAWRMHIRQVCTSAFARGYAVIDVLREGEWCYYVFEKDAV